MGADYQLPLLAGWAFNNGAKNFNRSFRGGAKRGKREKGLPVGKKNPGGVLIDSPNGKKISGGSHPFWVEKTFGLNLARGKKRVVGGVPRDMGLHFFFYPGGIKCKETRGV